jgi:hypothetical protein
MTTGQHEAHEIVHRLNAIDAKLAHLLAIAIDFTAIAMGVVGYYFSSVELDLKRPYPLLVGLAFMAWALFLIRRMGRAGRV